MRWQEVKPGAALVTGGAHRLGRAMCVALAEWGWDVAVHYASSKTAAEDLVTELRTKGVQAVALHADLLEEDATSRLVALASAAFGQPLTILVNNASIFEYDTIKSATLASWNRHISSNLRAPFVLTQEFARQVPKSVGEGEHEATGMIVNMVDQRVRKLTPEFMTYTLAKMGLWALTQTTAQALAPDIRVNAIGPGPTLQGARQTDAHFAKQRRSTILQRGANAAEIVTALRFILESPGVTGQLICVDGGQHLAWLTPDISGVE